MTTKILPALEIGPRKDAAGAVIWLHGLGANGHDFEDVVPMLELPEVRFVLPHAPARPVTLNMGMIMPAWYDIVRLDGPDGHAAERHVRESCAQLAALVAREEQRGVASGRVVLAGFSQGGAIALHQGTRHPSPLGGILVLSSYEVLPDTRAEWTEANRATPMLFCHGSQDPLVPLERGRLAYEAHVNGVRAAEWHEYPMAHQVCLEEIELVRGWLKARFA